MCNIDFCTSLLVVLTLVLQRFDFFHRFFHDMDFFHHVHVRFSLSDWGPSDQALAGSGWISTIIPSAPAATPALAIGGTRSQIPVPWLGSTMIGKWLFLMIGTALKSKVLRVAVSCSDPTFNENHFTFILNGDVFRCIQPFVDRARDASFKANWFPSFPNGS